MEALLDFVYHGVVHIPQDNLTSLLKTAEGLQVKNHALFILQNRLVKISLKLFNKRCLIYCSHEKMRSLQDNPNV